MPDTCNKSSCVVRLRRLTDGSKRTCFPASGSTQTPWQGRHSSFKKIRENHGIASRAVAREVGHSAMTLSSLPCQPVQCPPRNMRTPSRRRGTGAPLPLRQARDVDAFDAPLLTQLVASAGRRAPEADWLPPAPRYQPHRAQAHSHLGAELQTDALVGLNADDQEILRQPVDRRVAKHGERSLLELDRHFSSLGLE